MNVKYHVTKEAQYFLFCCRLSLLCTLLCFQKQSSDRPPHLLISIKGAMVDLNTVAANPLEQFVLLAKNAKGAAAVELIKQALEAPTVFVFGELLDMANIQVS